MDIVKIRPFVSSFCSKNTFSLAEEQYIRSCILEYAGLSKMKISKTKSGKPYQPLLDVISSHIEISDELHAGRLYELFNRDKTNNLKNWRMTGMFDHLYHFIAVKQQLNNISNRVSYLSHHPELIAEFYSTEDMLNILPGQGENLINMINEWKHENPAPEGNTTDEQPPSDIEPVAAETSSPAVTIPPDWQKSLEKEQRQRRFLGILSTVLFFLVIILTILHLRREPSPAEASPPVFVLNPTPDMAGDSLGTASVVFQSSEKPDSIWPYGKLTLYRFRNAPSDKTKDTIWLARVTGLFRKSGDSWEPNDVTMFGLVSKAGNYFQFNLLANKRDENKVYGRWHATLYIESGNIADLYLGVNCFGVATGISKYTGVGQSQDKISNYILEATSLDVMKTPDDIFLRAMEQKIDPPAQPLRFKNIRTMFKNSKDFK